MSDDKPRELDVEEIFAELGITRLPGGGLRVPSLNRRPWLFAAAGIMLLAFLGSIVGGGFYMRCPGPTTERLLPILAVWVLVLVGLIGLYWAIGRLFIDFRSDGLRVGRRWPPGLRWSRHVSWRNVRGVSLLDWKTAGTRPGFTIMLHSGDDIPVEWVDIPLSAAVLLPLIVEEARLPDEYGRVLLAARDELVGVMSRDPIAVASALPPSCHNCEVVSNTADEVSVTMRGGKITFALTGIILGGMTSGCLALALVREGPPPKGLQLFVVLMSVLILGCVVTTIHFLAWKQRLHASRTELRLISGGIFGKTEQVLDADQISSCRRDYDEVRTSDFEESTGDTASCLILKSSARSLSIGDGLTIEALGWLEARLQALWGLGVPEETGSGPGPAFVDGH